ncbi:MarR family winged helix-turn-helix transcriptional regulator [Actinomadura sp. 9N407]|uniref:MarR family winged helix-turn-helix transcriptional regulator n=1 Tax=Actinomadura sp. 9N407 TaxID=3375154 RepID=UPI0037955E92
MTDLFNDPRLTYSGLLLEASGGLVDRMQPVLKEHGLSGLDLNALMRLSRSPGQRLRMTDLAAQIRLSTSGVTRLMDRLARSGLAEREACAEDRRTTYAVLTPAGAERLEQVLPSYLDFIERWFTGVLTSDQLASLADGLRIVRDTVHPEAAALTPDETSGS